ncbi:MAG: (d)CMP kinase [Candidatus Omnitrophota bacterium]
MRKKQPDKKFIPHPENHVCKGMDEWFSGGIPLHERKTEKSETTAVLRRAQDGSKDGERSRTIKPRSFIVAIDGPAGSGKSTVAKHIARKMHFLYIDTGAMYRAVTLKALRKKVNLVDKEALIHIAKHSKIKLSSNHRGRQKVFLDGEDVTGQIRTPQLTRCVAYIAKVKGVREHMVYLQRKLGRTAHSVLEGRDIGTVVFPNADIKFYLDASLDERTLRRFKELKKTNAAISLDDVKKDVTIRDKKDMTRKYAPLKRAKDAFYIDTTPLSIKEVTDTLRTIIRKKYGLS